VTHPPTRVEEDNNTVAKKAAKRATVKKATKTPVAAKKAPVKAKAAVKVKAAAPTKRPAALAHPVTPGPDLGERAERLRDEIQRSKLTHPDPWGYAAKARGWSDRAQGLVQMVFVQGDTASVRAALEALDAELQRDRDFQEARRLF
jgi:hypothetical protein